MTDEFFNYNPKGKTLLDRVIKGGLNRVIFVNLRNDKKPYAIISFEPREFDVPFLDSDKKLAVHAAKLNGYPTICELNRGGNLSLQGGLLVDYFRDPVYSPKRITKGMPEHMIVDPDQLRLFMEGYSTKKRLAG